MSNVTAGRWQLRWDECQADDRWIEVVSWETIERMYRSRLEEAGRNYRSAIWHLRRGHHTSAEQCVQIGLQHKLAACALVELLIARECSITHTKNPRSLEAGLFPDLNTSFSGTAYLSGIDANGEE